MGMLMHQQRQRQRAADPDPVAPKRRRRSRRAKPDPAADPAPDPAPVPAPSPYADLADEQLLEAYAASVPDGQAVDAEAMRAELDAALVELAAAGIGPVADQPAEADKADKADDAG